MENQKSWQGIEELKQWADSDDWVICEVGFLLEENKEYILIANKQTIYDIDNPEFEGVMKIPRTWIKKRIDLSSHIK